MTKRTSSSSAPAPARKAKASRRPLPASAVTKLRTELLSLQQALAVTAQAYVERLHREIEELAQQLPCDDRKLKAAEVRVITEMHDRLIQLQIKPARGRRKDLKKIDLLIGELQALAEEGQISANKAPEFEE